MQLGAVWLTRGQYTQRLRRASKPLLVGDEVHLYYDEKVLKQTPAPAQLIADEGQYSVWFKPFGMLSQGSKWGDHCSIARWVEQQLQPQRPAFIVHRLDRAASGLILIAHGKGSATQLAELFQQRAVEKRYRLLVAGKFPSKPSPYLIEKALDERAAISRVSRLQYAPETKQSLLEVSIETGRKHQIRRHLSAMGFPVVGDRLYGSQEQIQDLQLSACYLEFVCPLTGKKKKFMAPEALLPIF
jgi:tRNA pseudouridine32 synthase/23S rRNA pseudouridine746 synthase